MKWKDVEEILNTNDGSLPDIELNNLEPDEVIKGYEVIRNCAERISSEAPYYWLKNEEKEIIIKFNSNPSELVISDEAEPFHVCFDGIKSPKGKKVPELGVFVFTDSLSVDYRMGKEWNAEAIEGLFEIIEVIHTTSNQMILVHKSNINDIDGSILRNKWSEYLNA